MRIPSNIYVLKDPRTNEVRYIGFTDNPKRRLAAHLTTCNSERNHKANWVRSLVNLALRPTLEIIEETNSPVEREMFWIKHYRALGARLTNSTDGGEGVLNPSLENRAKKRAAALGRKHTPETLAKMRAANLGKVFTEEHLSKLRGRRATPETKAKMRAAHVGRVGYLHTQATKDKMRALKLGRPLTAEHKANLSKAQTGRRHSSVTLEKMRVSRMLWLERNSRSVVKLES